MTGGRFSGVLGLVVVVAAGMGRLQQASGEDTAFTTANKTVLATMEKLRVTLESVKDAKSASAAAKALPAITDQFVSESKAATLLYVSLSGEEKQDAVAAMQEDLIAKIKAGKLNPKNDLLSLMVDLSKGPQRAIMEKPLTQLRDTLLEQKSIYVPVSGRESIAKKLGAHGTPLPK